MTMPRAHARLLRLIRHVVALTSRQAAIGGQAVLDGVMMRGPDSWAVAVRRVDGSIAVHERSSQAFTLRHRWARLPIIRGIIALGESLAIGFRALSVSAEYAMEWEEANERKEAGEQGAAQQSSPVEAAHEVEAEETYERAEAAPEKLTKWAIAGAFVLALGFSVLLFKMTPALATSAIVDDKGSFWFALLEGCVRVSIFIAYLAVVGLMPDMKRVFQYHSAEHKAINAWEHEIELQPSAVNEQSRIHVRCGTAFLLWVFVIGILVYGLYGHWRNPELPEILLSRLVGLPLLAGISFEVIRFAGRFPDSRILRGALAPGLWLQRLTTRECDPEHCEVSIASLNAVLAHKRGDSATAEDTADPESTDEAIVV